MPKIGTHTHTHILLQINSYGLSRKKASVTNVGGYLECAGFGTFNHKEITTKEKKKAPHHI